jgi:hypothetical protein
MILSLASLLALSPSAPGFLPVPVRNAIVLVARGDDAELDAKIAAAGRDVAKLLDLASSYLNSPQNDWATKIYKRVLEIDPNNEPAHKALRHQLYDKKWFESFAELSKYKREEAAKMKEKGLARYKEEWVPEADLPFLEMGWAQGRNGEWQNPAELERAKLAADFEARGFRFRADDSSWVGPDDFPKWEAIQWKCGDEWVDTAKANDFHSKPEHAWKLAGEHFDVETTLDWDGANSARWYAEKSWPELVRLFGLEPKSRPHFVVANGLAQYNQVAGNPPLLPEFEGYSSFHGAYFADLFFDTDAKPVQFRGCGVSYWERKDAKAGSWGPFWARWAAAQSFVEAIDPSWSAVGDRIAATGATEDAAFIASFWAEKRIPQWLRYGAASYVERFLKNPEAAEGADPWTIRAFAFGEVKKSGGLRKLDDVFAFGLNINDIPGSTRLYGEAGVVVSYLLDGTGGDKGLAEKHAAFKSALASGKTADAKAASTALQQELSKHEADVRKFAGL